MRHFISLLVLCYVITLASSQNSYLNLVKRILGNGRGGGAQQPNYNYGGGQQPNYNYEAGQQPNYNYGGGQQPNYNYGGGQQPNYNYGGGQQPNYNYGGGQQPMDQNYYWGGQNPQNQDPSPQIECDPPMCAPGCSLQTVYAGPCPGCQCTQEGGQQQNNNYGGGQQPNYNYGGGQQPNYNYGDPTPRISCDPPMCAPGCSLQTVYDGPCPGCQCPQEAVHPPMDQNYYWGGHNPDYHYGGGQQPNYNYGGGQQPTYNYGGGQQPNYNYGGGQQQGYNYGGIQPAQGNNGGCQPTDCAPFCRVGTGPDGCPECICIQN